MSKIIAVLKKIQIHQVILGIGGLILFTQYIWKFLYVGGIIPGAYWLFFYLDEWFFDSIKYTFILGAIVLVLWGCSKLFFKGVSEQLLRIFSAVILTGIAIVLTFPMVLARSTVFIERLKIENTVYYLSAYPMFAEVNYSVAECEFTGQFCRTIFVSGDITNSNWRNSHLEYDESKQEIMLMEAEEGLIFAKVLE